MNELDGLRAIVTGGASGIGLATAPPAGRTRREVAVLDLDPGRRSTGTAAGFRADVSDDASVRAAVADGRPALGGLDILVNNAGIGAAGTVEDNPDEQWHRVLDVNVLGMVRTTRAALPHLRGVRPRRDRQHLLDRRHGRPAAARPVLGEQGRRTGADPGHGRRPRARGHPGQLREPRHRRHPLGRPTAGRRRRPRGRARRAERPPAVGRLVTAAEVAAAIAYLASPAAASVTGTALAVDGGMAGLRLRPAGRTPSQRTV